MIPLFKVSMSPNAAALVAETLNSGYIGQGPRVEEFEERLGIFLSSPTRPITTSSCTHALDLAFHLVGIRPGSEVISTPVTCTATNSQLVTRGARIVWADVDPETGLISVEDVAKKVNRRTVAIVAVDWAGRLCDYESLCKLGPPVIQDAAHSFLASRVDSAGIEVRSRGHFTCYSFQAIKHFTTGDGGALVVPPEYLKRARLLRWYGLDREAGQSFRCAQTIEEIGYKYHMNDIAASIGLANLHLGEENVGRHRANAHWFEQTLKETDKFHKPPWDKGSSWWLYTCLVDDQARFIEHMKNNDVSASPVHARNDKHPEMQFWSGDLPGVDYFTTHEVCIPVGWWLESPQDKDRIVYAVNSYE